MQRLLSFCKNCCKKLSPFATLKNFFKKLKKMLDIRYTPW